MRKATLAYLLIAILARLATAGTLILKRAWIEQYKDRATIDATFTTDHAHKKPNPPAKDGDMHVAGRAPKEVGLPMVAEVMNAAAQQQQKAVQVIHGNEGSGSFVPVSGAWRLWFEHPATSQTQFQTVPPAANTNPDHSFEIHPITKFAAEDITGSFAMVPGFPGHDPKTAFGSYEKLSVLIHASATAVTLDSAKTGFNYVHFRMHLIGSPVKLKDGGLAAMADVEDDASEGEDMLAAKVRMIFVPGTAPWKAVQGKGDGDEFTVLGIPRVNLNAISAFITAAGSAAVTRKLPYEMIVVAVK
ncbi:MAG: hypothetical protein ABSH44_22780 [Bryobacteraceae bacterium]|jgi:hypothetical protein